MSIFMSESVVCSKVVSFFIFTVLILKKIKVCLGQPVLFPLHKHRGTPTGFWGHWFFFFFLLSLSQCQSAVHSLTHPPTQSLDSPQTNQPTNQDLDTSCYVGLCVAYVLSHTQASTKRDKFWSRPWCVLHLCGHSGWYRSDHVTLGIFHSFLWINTSKSP